MSTDKNLIRAVSVTMHLEPLRASGSLDPDGIEHVQRSEEMLLTLPSRRLLEAVYAWNAAGRPFIDPRTQTKHVIPGTRPEDERPTRGRYLDR